MTSKAKMTKSQEELFRIFKMAIIAEQDAQKMYKKAASYCDDEDIKAILHDFIAEEESHENKLMELYDDLKKKLEII
jgi:rubrerythrin